MGKGREPVVSRPFSRRMAVSVTDRRLDVLDVDSDGCSEPGAIVFVGLIEVADHSPPDVDVFDPTEIGSEVLDEIVLFVLVQRAIELARLPEIVLLVDGS